MGAHTTSDDPTRYRIASEVEAWQAKDPILRLRRHLERAGVSDTFFGEVADDAARLAVGLRERVLALPDPPPLEMFDHVYAGGSPDVAEQRESFARYLTAFVPEGSEGGRHS
jgi:pyruvate dehydrogenase E1 component alpha subunit